MTPPATAVASDVQSLARPAPRKRIARRSAQARLMHRWRKRLFVAVARNAARPVDFRLPHERPITMGWQVRL